MSKDQPATKHDLQVAQDEIAQATNNALATEMKSVHSLIGGLDSRMDGFDSRMDKFDSRMDKFDSRMNGLEKGQASLKSATTAILKVVDSIEGRLKRWEQIPDKVERLHKRVFR